MQRPALVLLFVLITSCYSLWGQQKKFLSFKHYTQKEGLSSYNITKIFQDKFGFFWITTQDGLNCFNGRRFRIFSKEMPIQFALNGNNVVDITEDTLRNRLYVATSYGGITCINTFTQRVLPDTLLTEANKYLTGKWTRCLSLSGDILWIGTYGGLCALNIRTGAFTRPDKLSWKGIDVPNLKVNKILSGVNGHTLICCDGYGAILLNDRTIQPVGMLSAPLLNHYNNNKSLQFWAVSRGHQMIYLATNWGLRTLSITNYGLKVVMPAEKHFFYEGEIFSCAEDQQGMLWLSNAKGLYRYNTSSGDCYQIMDASHGADAWESAIYAIYADRRGNIWAGSEEGLSFIANKTSAFEQFYESFQSSVRIQHAFSICPLNDTTILCGAANGLYRVNSVDHSILRIDDRASCYLIQKLPDKRIIISNAQGTFVLDDGRLQPVCRFYPTLKAIQHEQLSAMAIYQDTLVILGSLFHKGVHVWSLRTGKLRSYNNERQNLPLNDELVNCIYNDRTGNIWILSVNTVFRFNPIDGSYQSYAVKIPPYGILFDMCESANHYWMAAYGVGLIKTDKQFRIQQIISAREGLSNNGVYKVFSFADSLVLVTSNNGLSVLNTNTGRIKRYSQSDGLQSDAFEQFCGASYGDAIYTGGLNGFSRIRPAFFKEDTVRPVVNISSVQVKTAHGFSDTTDLKLQTLKIPSDVLQTSIFFSALNFSHPDNVSFSYKIKELHNEWLDIGAQDNISLVGLGPGSYTLQVRGVNTDGMGNGSYTSLQLIYLPKWYQQWWFKLLIICFCACIVIAIYKYRIYQLQRQQQIRKDIAGDLHDDIGGTLNTIKIFTHLAKSEDEKGRSLIQVEESLSYAISGLRDLLWVLDDKDDTVAGLMDRIKKNSLPVAIARNIHLECTIQEGIEELILSKKEKRNLLLIAKEAINNSVKYANCTEVLIGLKMLHGRLGLSICDDGIGFDTSSQPEGYGLKNIRERAIQIGFHAKIDTTPGKGVTIIVVKGR